MFEAKHIVRTPGSRVAMIEVRCEEAMGGTRARVTYTSTAISEEGNCYVSDFTEVRYREYIDSWQRAIHRFLTGNESWASALRGRLNG